MNFKDLTAILACPACKGKLDFLESESNSGYLCPVCEKVYPIRDDIPIMLIEEAIPLEKWAPKKEGA